MTSITHSTSFSIPARLEDVRLIAASANTIFSQLGFNSVDVYQLELSVVEAANNIIIHAYRNQPDKWLDFSLEVTNKKILCIFKDRGRTADFLNNPNPELPQNYDIEALSTHKRGVTIFCTVMDEVLFESRDGVNTITLVKYLPAKACK